MVRSARPAGRAAQHPPGLLDPVATGSSHLERVQSKLPYQQFRMPPSCEIKSSGDEQQWSAFSSSVGPEAGQHNVHRSPDSSGRSATGVPGATRIEGRAPVGPSLASSLSTGPCPVRRAQRHLEGMTGPHWPARTAPPDRRASSMPTRSRWRTEEPGAAASSCEVRARLRPLRAQHLVRPGRSRPRPTVGEHLERHVLSARRRFAASTERETPAYRLPSLAQVAEPPDLFRSHENRTQGTIPLRKLERSALGLGANDAPVYRLPRKACARPQCTG